MELGAVSLCWGCGYGEHFRSPAFPLVSGYDELPLIGETDSRSHIPLPLKHILGTDSPKRNRHRPGVPVRRRPGGGRLAGVRGTPDCWEFQY